MTDNDSESEVVEETSTETEVLAYYWFSCGSCGHNMRINENVGTTTPYIRACPFCGTKEEKRLDTTRLFLPLDERDELLWKSEQVFTRMAEEVSGTRASRFEGKEVDVEACRRCGSAGYVTDRVAVAYGTTHGEPLCGDCYEDIVGE